MSNATVALDLIRNADGQRATNGAVSVAAAQVVAILALADAVEAVARALSKR
jgi:hypothetical protein